MHLSRPVAFLVAFLFLTAPLRANAQKQASITSTNWCKDSGTYCWAENSRTFSGIRFVAEPKFGYVFPGGASLNRIESEGLGKLTIFGFETNLVGTFASFQFALITPGTVKLDGKSPLRSSGRLVSPAGEISLDSGLAAGFSLLDGAVVFGYGRLNFDPRDIVNPTNAEKHSSYYYFNFQAISTIRSVIKAQK